MLNSIHHLLPDQAVPYLKWQTAIPVEFKLKKNRTSKWGFFKPGLNGQPHVVSINEELNAYAFLFTLTHEMAHVICWEKYGSKARAHGIEWKAIFKDELFKLFQQDVFPSQLVKPIWQTIANPRASCHANPELIRAFSLYDARDDLVFVDTLVMNSQFETTRGQRFIKGKKLRKRFRCQEISTGRWYVFSPVAQVIPIYSSSSSS